MGLAVYNLRYFPKKKRNINHFAGKSILIEIVWFYSNCRFQKQSLIVVDFMIHKNQTARDYVFANTFRL